MNKNSTDYTLEYLRRFQVPLIRSLNSIQAAELIKEINDITLALQSLREKVEQAIKSNKNTDEN